MEVQLKSLGKVVLQGLTLTFHLKTYFCYHVVFVSFYIGFVSILFVVYGFVLVSNGLLNEVARLASSPFYR